MQAFIWVSNTGPHCVCSLVSVHGGITVPVMLTMPSGREQPVRPWDNSRKGDFEAATGHKRALSFFSAFAIMDKAAELVLWQKVLEGLNIPLSPIPLNSHL